MTNTVSEAAHIKIIQLIAKELGVGPQQVAAAVALLDEGSTVPFIARYRKETTGNLDDTQLRNLEERLLYLRELEERRAAILASIEEQGKLTGELRAAIEAAATKQTLEDIYLPYKPKRRTRAQIAREAGMEPLADALFADPTLDPEQEAAKYVNVDNGVPDAQAALDGARDILAERFAETAELLAKLRARMWHRASGSDITIITISSSARISRRAWSHRQILGLALILFSNRSLQFFSFAYHPIASLIRLRPCGERSFSARLLSFLQNPIQPDRLALTKSQYECLAPIAYQCK